MYLIDTHTFLWAVCKPEELDKKTSDLLEGSSNEIYLSVVSFWEIAIKFSLGKLDLKGASPTELPDAARKMDFKILPFEASDAATCHNLVKTHHKDPFDRMLVWQAMRNNYTLVSIDRDISIYKAHGLLVFG